MKKIEVVWFENIFFTSLLIVVIFWLFVVVCIQSYEAREREIVIQNHIFIEEQLYDILNKLENEKSNHYIASDSIY